MYYYIFVYAIFIYVLLLYIIIFFLVRSIVQAEIGKKGKHNFHYIPSSGSRRAFKDVQY
jgi:hypothetical protein